MEGRYENALWLTNLVTRSNFLNNKNITSRLESLLEHPAGWSRPDMNSKIMQNGGLRINIKDWWIYEGQNCDSNLCVNDPNLLLYRKNKIMYQKFLIQSEDLILYSILNLLSFNSIWLDHSNFHSIFEFWAKSSWS